MNGVWGKVCFMIDTLERGGAQKQLLLIARELQREQRAPFQLVVFREPLSLVEEFRAAGVKVTVIRKKLALDPRFFWGLALHLRRVRPDTVVTFLPTADMWGRLAALVAGVRTIGSSVRTLPQDADPVRNFLLSVTDRFSDFIVCNSAAAAELTAKKHGHCRDKVSVIYNGIEPHQPRQEPGAVGPVTIGIVARLVEVKDLSTLLRAFAAVCKAGEVRLVIVGDGPLRPQLEQEAKALGVEKLVQFLGERSDVRQIISGFDIGVLSSAYEGLSNSIMEYMQAGKPVVASDVGGNRELVEHGVNGYLFRPGDHEELASALLKLSTSPEARCRMGRLGELRIASTFSVKAMVDGWERRLCSSPKLPGARSLLPRQGNAPGSLRPRKEPR